MFYTYNGLIVTCGLFYEGYFWMMKIPDMKLLGCDVYIDVESNPVFCGLPEPELVSLTASAGEAIKSLLDHPDIDSYRKRARKTMGIF